MLEALLFIVLFVIVTVLWGRVRNLEEQLAGAGYYLDRGPGPAVAPVWTPLEPPAVTPEPEPHPAPFPEPRPRPVTVWAPAPAEPYPQPSEDTADARAGISLEDLFGRRLPIWAGGVTLAIAGVLILRYSIESGLLSPLVRVVGGLLFGTALIVAAELALRLEARIRDVRVQQSLAGAGLATLYASILVGTNLYGLIGPLPGFLGLAGVTAAALALSLRFGAPSALLGLVGGLAAPALVGAAEPNVPLLTLYLALAVGGLCALSRSQRWAWLGISALVGGFGWGLVLILGGMLDVAAATSVGLYLLVIGIVFPIIALPGGASGRLARISGSTAAAAQIAALVATGGYSMLHWSLFGLISGAIIWLSRREPGLDRLPLVGLTLALLLIGVWPDPAAPDFAVVLVGAILVYGGPALLALWRPRGSMAEAAQIALLALAGAALTILHFHRADGSMDAPLALVTAALALLPSAAALLGWNNAGWNGDGRFALLVSAAALLAAVAASFALPLAALPVAIGVIGAALLLLGLRAEDERIEWAAWIAAAVTLPLLVAGEHAQMEVARLFGAADPFDAMPALLRWGGLAAVAALYAWRARINEARRFAQGVAALLAYGAAAQVLPSDALALVPPAALLGLALLARRVACGTLLPALSVAFALSLAWAAGPLTHWSVPALASLAGQPLLATGLPPAHDALLRLLAPAGLIAAAWWSSRPAVGEAVRRGVGAAALLLGAGAIHILFKQAFGLASHEDFVTYGMAERLSWECLLAAAAGGAWLFERPRAALACGAAAMAHLCWYSLVLHNPLWASQAVGSAPLTNLIVGTYGLAFALLAFANRCALLPAGRERPRDAARMLLIVVFGFSTLRQLAHGSLLNLPSLSQSEDILRSILTVVLAIGFLLWALRTGSRDWRVGSLLLMLAAVAKVFLFDASGLEGLLRIASFVALGGSLIGIGWLYSRSLRTPQPLTEPR